MSKTICELINSFDIVCRIITHSDYVQCIPNTLTYQLEASTSMIKTNHLN
jgi:hypothetical protein